VQWNKPVARTLKHVFTGNSGLLINPVVTLLNENLAGAFFFIELSSALANLSPVSM